MGSLSGRFAGAVDCKQNYAGAELRASRLARYWLHCAGKTNGCCYSGMDNNCLPSRIWRLVTIYK